MMHDDDKYFSLNAMSGGNAEEEQLESTEEETMNIDSNRKYNSRRNSIK